MRAVYFTRKAESDLRDVLTFIARDNEEAAYSVRDAILETCDELLSHPKRAVLMPSRLRIRRALVKHYGNYVIFFEEIPEGIRIVRLGYGGRNWVNLLQ